jgi:hypothetical protein
MTQLWSVVGGRLDPVVDDAGHARVCPITLDTLMDPVMISDGGIYEKASIAQWLQTHRCAPCTNVPLRHKRLLKLESLHVVIQDVLHAEGNDSDKNILDKAAQEAEMAQVPSQDCHANLRTLQAALTTTTLKLVGLQEAVPRAEQAAHELQNRISTWAATCIKASTQMFAARAHLALLGKDANREAVAAVRIQKSWLEYRRKKARREKRRRKRMSKKAKVEKQGPTDRDDMLCSASNSWPRLTTALLREKQAHNFQFAVARAIERRSCEAVLGGMDADEAKALCDRAWEAMAELQGPHHLETFKKTNYFAEALCGMGKYEEAEALCRRTWEEMAEKLGSDYYGTELQKLVLIDLLCNMGRLDEADALQGSEPSLPYDEVEWGEDAPDLTDCYEVERMIRPICDCETPRGCHHGPWHLRRGI